MDISRDASLSLVTRSYLVTFLFLSTLPLGLAQAAKLPQVGRFQVQLGNEEKPVILSGASTLA